MKKQIMALSALALSVMGGLNMAHAQDGTVTFNGSIVSDTCVLSTDSKDITVDFGQMSQDAARGGATDKNFTIDLTTCPAAASRATVVLNAESANSGNYSIADYIDNVKSKMVDGDYSYWMIINDTTNAGMLTDGTITVDSDFTIAAGDNKLPLRAQFNGGSGPSRKIGSHTGEATYTISYQ